MKNELHKGQLTVWKDDRGFGFIKPSNGGKEVFLHISAFKDRNDRPQVGDVIGYRLTFDESGRPRADSAFIEKTIASPISRPPALRTRTTSKPKSLSLALEVLILAIVPVLGSLHFAFTTGNFIPLILYASMSFVTFGIYADDKSRAEQGQWRVPETTLHLCELMGGWLGAFVAQRKLHHKSSKSSYQIVFWVIVAVHIGFWLNWLFLDGI